LYERHSKGSTLKARILWCSFALAAFGCSSPTPAGFPDGSPSALVEAASEDAGRSIADDTSAEDAESEATTCDRRLPTCPTTPPSYQNDVAPIIARECSACHYAGSAIARGVFSTYAQLQEGRGSVLNEVYACKMPVAPVRPLTASDRDTLLAWIECGGPNN
jgi:hypothetical protein